MDGCLQTIYSYTTVPHIASLTRQGSGEDLSSVDGIVLLPDDALEIASLVPVWTVLPCSIVHADQLVVDEYRARFLDIQILCEFH